MGAAITLDLCTTSCQAGVMAVQQRLKQSGAYGGPTDGVWGPESAAALEQFQRAHGLQVTGQLNQATVATLGLNPARPFSRCPGGGADGFGPRGRAAVARCHPCCPEPPSPARLLFRAHRWDLGAKHAGLTAALSTGSWPTSNGAAESHDRDGAWSGSEQSCRSAGNCRPGPVTANPALVYLFAAVAAGRQTAPNSICKSAGPGARADIARHALAAISGRLWIETEHRPAPQELKARIAPEEKEELRSAGNE
jgi:hypothetical protein